MHGLSKTKIWNSWKSMKDRCNYEKHNRYKNYGGRGIIYDKKWSKFEEFKNDMYESYLEHCKEFGEKQTTIDRIDINGNYNKENCRWATYKLQNRNTSRNRYYKGKCISQWCEELGLNYSTVKTRINSLGWSIEDALSLN